MTLNFQFSFQTSTHPHPLDQFYSWDVDTQVQCRTTWSNSEIIAIQEMKFLYNVLVAIVVYEERTSSIIIEENTGFPSLIDLACHTRRLFSFVMQQYFVMNVHW